MDRELAMEYIRQCARSDFDEGALGATPDFHEAIARWQAMHDGRMSAAMSTLGRLQTVMLYMSAYVAEAIATDRMNDVRRAMYEALARGETLRVD